MPVLDHEVRERTKQDSDARYGCHDKPRKREPLLVRDGWAESKTPNGFHLAAQLLETVLDFGSLECRYDKSLTDPKCAECEHRGSGERYSEQIRANGA